MLQVASIVSVLYFLLHFKLDILSTNDWVLPLEIKNIKGQIKFEVSKHEGPKKCQVLLNTTNVIYSWGGKVLAFQTN